MHMKRVKILFLASLMAMTTTACSSELDKTVKSAQEAYNESNYSNVIDILEDVKDKPEAKSLYTKAIIKLANSNFEKGEYEKVVDDLKDLAAENNDAKELYENAQFEIISDNVKNINRLTKDTQISEVLLKIEEVYEKDDKRRIELEDSLIDIVAEYFNDEPTYEDFENWESAIKTLKNEKVGSSISFAKNLSKKLDSFSKKKLQLALVGTWIREDDTGMNGAYIELSFQDNTGIAILTKAPENPWGFVKGDLKWKNINIIDGNNFVFDDLERNASTYYDYFDDSYVTDYSHDYYEGSGNFNFDSQKITVHITDNGNGDGTDQIWVKKASKNNTKVKDKASKVEPANTDEYILPNSSTEYLTDADVSSLSKEQLRLARNEIFARHGYIFKDSTLNDYFMSKSWYSGTISSDDFDMESTFSKIEKANINKIKEFE